MALLLSSLDFHANLFIGEFFPVYLKVTVSPFLQTSKLYGNIFSLDLELLLVFLHSLKTV